MASMVREKALQRAEEARKREETTIRGVRGSAPLDYPSAIWGFRV